MRKQGLVAERRKPPGIGDTPDGFRRAARIQTTSLAALSFCLFSIAMGVAALGDGPALSRAEFDRLHKELNLKNQPWATIPWKVTLTEARESAAKLGKPIFLVVNTGNCLGFV